MCLFLASFILSELLLNDPASWFQLFIKGLFCDPIMLSLWHMRCDLGNQVWSWTLWHFQFVFDWNAHLEWYILLKTPPEFDQWFQSYEQVKDSQNNKKQKEIHSFFWISHNQALDFRLIPLDRNTYSLVDVHKTSLFLNFQLILIAVVFVSYAWFTVSHYCMGHHVEISECWHDRVCTNLAIVLSYK